MPKIKAYKGNGVIIPVDAAKISTAYQCPWTNRIFSTKNAYVKHLRVIRTDRIHRAIRARIRDKIFDELINQDSFQKIIEWIETHPDFIFDTMFPYGRDRWNKDISQIRNQFWVKVTHIDVDWSDRVSNSHSCPRGGVTNWGGNGTLKDGSLAPRGYPGWGGRIEFHTSHDLGFGVSDCFKRLGIHTGTGGGSGGNRYGHDVKFFASDWPGLEKIRTFEILRGDRPAKYRGGEPKYFR